MRFSKDQKADIIKRYNEGSSAIQIAASLGKPRNTIYSLLRRAKVKFRVSWLNSRKYAIDETFFEKIDTPNKAQVLGLVYADGGLWLKNYTLRIALKDTDVAYLEQVRLAMHCDKPLRFKEETQRERTYRCYVLDVSSRKMSGDLLALGVTPNKSLTLQAPNAQWLPKDLRRDFIRGYFEGDGSIYKQRNCYRIGIVGTESMMKWIGEVVREELGIEVKITKPKGVKVWYLGIIRQFDVYRVMKWFYDHKPIIAMARKQAALEDLKQAAIAKPNVFSSSFRCKKTI